MTELNIDKTDWKKVKFGDIVREPRESTKDLIADGFEHIVGLEHIDSGDIHLRKSETEDLETSFTKIFRKGDVLFGRRRAYLKKAALAEFDGVCSGDITLFRVKRDLIPELLPFVVHNENFFDFAIKHSAGGLSPRVKFKDLAKYEFLLPPLDQQKQLAQLLWAMDEVIEKEKMVREKLDITLYSILKGFFSKIIKREKLINLCTEKPRYGANSPSIDYNNKHRYIRITDITELNGLNEEKVSARDFDKRYTLEYGDFLLARSADPGRSFYYKDEYGMCIYAGYLIKFPLDLKKILPEYLFYFTKTKEFKIWITQTSRAGTIKNINSKEFSNVNIPIVSLNEQKRIVDKIKAEINRKKILEAKIQSSETLLRSLIHQIF